MLGAYKIVHIKTGKIYVGSSQNISTRLTKHWLALRKGHHHNMLLQELYDVCGKAGFRIKKKECNTREEAYGVEYKAICTISESKLLNIGLDVIGGDNITNNPRYKQIVAKIKKNTKRFMDSLSKEERIEKFGRPGSLNGMYGKTHTKEVREKLSKLKTGNQHAKGCVRTKEQREHLSRYLRENKLREGARNGFYGKSHSVKTRKHLSKVSKGRMPPNAKPVKVDGKKYKSAKSAAKLLGIPYVTLWHRCNNPNPKFSNYQFI